MFKMRLSIGLKTVHDGEPIRQAQGEFFLVQDGEAITVNLSDEILDSYVVMWSGGKDSCLAFWLAQKQGLSVKGIVNIYDEQSERVRFHGTPKELIQGQAELMEVPCFQFPSNPETYELAFLKALGLLKERGAKGIVFGNIHLADVRQWCEERTTSVGFHHVEPLWHRDGLQILGDFVEAGFEAILTCCESKKLDRSWLGRPINHNFIKDIPRLKGVDPCGENGEYHSFVFNGPLFSEKLALNRGETREGNGFVQLDLQRAEKVELV